MKPTSIPYWDDNRFMIGNSLFFMDGGFLLASNRRHHKFVTSIYFSILKKIYWGKTVRNEREKRGWMKKSIIWLERNVVSQKENGGFIFPPYSYKFPSSQSYEKNMRYKELIISQWDHIYSWISQWLIFPVTEFLLVFAKRLLNYPHLLEEKLELQRKTLVQRQNWLLWLMMNYKTYRIHRPIRYPIYNWRVCEQIHNFLRKKKRKEK